MPELWRFGGLSFLKAGSLRERIVLSVGVDFFQEIVEA
jgi:hypothetical protein